jgi:hypothetical protein
MDIDALVEKLKSGRADADDVDGFLKELWRGYPVARLRSLTTSNNIAVLRQLSFILAELGTKASSVLDCVSPLIAHSDIRICLDAFDVVLCNASIGDGELIASVLQRIVDSNGAVRIACADFVSKCSDEQLRESLPILSTPLNELIQWFVRTVRSLAVEEIREQLTNHDRSVRLIAIAGAIRLYRYDKDLLVVAAKSLDPELSEFATEKLDFFERMDQLDRRRADQLAKRTRRKRAVEN